MTRKRDWWKQAQRDQRALEAWLDRTEPPVARKVAKSKNKLIRKIAAAYEGAPDAAFSLYEREHAQEIEAILRKVYARVIPVRASYTLDSIRSAKRWPEYEGFFDRLIALWTARNALQQAQGIADTTMSDVRRIIQRGIDEGQGNAKVARDIRKVTAFSAFRAAAVARTEIHNAALFAQDEIAKQAEVDFGIKLMKFWIPTLDGRTRDAHAAMIRHEGVLVGDKFNVGGVRMDRPGDPNGGATNVVNCRCGLVHREVEIEG